MNLIKRLFSKKKKEEVSKKSYAGWSDYQRTLSDDNPIADQWAYSTPSPDDTNINQNAIYGGGDFGGGGASGTFESHTPSNHHYDSGSNYYDSSSHHSSSDSSGYDSGSSSYDSGSSSSDSSSSSSDF